MTIHPEQRRRNALAFWVLVIGIAAIPVGLIAQASYGLGPFLIGSAAMLTGMIALIQIHRSHGAQFGRWPTWIGIVFGLLAVLVGMVIGMLALFLDLVVELAKWL